MRTIQNWEQGHRHPTGPAKVLLRLVKADPESVFKNLHRNYAQQKPVLNSLVTLLEKNIPTHQIIDQCIKELKQTNKANKNDPTRSKPLKTLNKYDQKRKKDANGIATIR